MASWADEFDIDDSDILGALNKRKEISQLTSPPWPPEAAAAISRALDPPHSIAASASFLKRLQKPRPSQNGASLPQSPGDYSVDPSRKRKQGFDPNPLALKAAYEQTSCLDIAISRENPREYEPDIRTKSHNQEQETSVSAAEEHFHSLSSHVRSPTPARKESPNCYYLRNVESHNTIRDEEMPPSAEPLIERQPNLLSGQGKTAFMPPKAGLASKQSNVLDKMQQRRTNLSQAKEKACNTRPSRTSSASEQEHDLVDMMDCTQRIVADGHLGMRAPLLEQEPVHDAPSGAGPGENSVPVESRSIRSLEKNLQYQIPGPAGTVQRGLGQKSNSSCQNDRVVNNNLPPGRVSVIDDADFLSGAWLKAKNYLEKSSISVSTIGSIKTLRTENRVPKLLAVIKACTPNGCGDVIVNLKDHSDFMNGIVNRRVMLETEFGRIIEPGAVILLHQVAVFSPTPYAHYLNITVSNVEQVYAKGVQFFQGECSHAAYRGMPGSMQANDQPSHSKAGKADFCAPEASRRRSVFELLEEDDELEILLAPSGHLHKTQD